jgi:HAE1 family hydrophobic/amphiphilic exporter-1
MELAKDVDCDVEVSASMMDMQALMGNGISVMIKGRNIETLQNLAREVAASMEGIVGIEELDDGLDDMTKTLMISVDKKKAADYGLTVAQIYGVIAGELASTNATTAIETDIKDYDVFVETDKQANVTIDDLKKLKLTYTDRKENEEKEIALSSVATFTEGEELSQVLRDNQSRYVKVSASIDADHNIGLVGNEVKEKLKNVAVPEGYSITMNGEDETINEAMRQVLLMMLLAVILIYLIMVAQFQSLKSPFIIMFTIPLAFTGGFFALFLAGKAVSVIAMVGFVMLAGIIVNNGIVLVDYINQLRREGKDKKEAIIESARTRLRPVLMTALTTIISMSTMAVGMGKGTEMSQPMAIVVVGGMIYGTILTLVLVPCLYDAFNKEKDMTEEEL